MASLVLRRHCMLCLATVRHLNLLVTSTAKQIHSSSYNDEAADIVISGGGMVGNAMACALGHEELLKDKKIIVLEGAPKKHFKLPEKFSNRTVAISPSSKELFSSKYTVKGQLTCVPSCFGAWDEIEQMRTRAVTRMQVWEACSDSLIHFDKKEMDEPLAYIVENDVVQEATTRRLEEVADTVKIRYNTTAKSFIIPEANNTSQNSWVQVELEDGNVLKTKLLIGADGMNSAVRKAGNFRTYTQNYNQMAVVATLKLAMTEDNCVAWQRFLPTGPIAMLPLSEEYSNLIWTTTPENARHLKELPTDSFVDAVNDAFIHDRDVDENAVHVGSLFQSVIDTVIPGSEKAVRQIPPMICDIDDKSRASFPLSLVSSYNYVSPRVALIGDAAHRVHPLAGQGVNLGFGDVICLRDLLVKCVENGGDVGSVLHLQQYETSRQRAVIPIMATIHGLNSLYKTTFPPVVIARSLGLQASNSLSFVKNFFMSGASSSKVSFFSS